MCTDVKCDLSRNSPHLLIPHIVARASCRKVLDLGWGLGEIASALSRAGAQVVGCELDEGRARAAQGKGLAVIQGDILSEDTWRAIGRQAAFDAAVLADVLDHLGSDEFVFSKLKETLKSRAVVVVSLPNVAHYRTESGCNCCEGTSTIQIPGC